LSKDHTALLQAVRTALSAFKSPVAPGKLIRCFLKARTAKVTTLRDELVKLDWRFIAAGVGMRGDKRHVQK